MKKLFFLCLGLCLLNSCEKEITIDLNSSDVKYVIEGVITDSEGPYFVHITKSVSFSDGNEFPSVSGALVRISDSVGNEEVLSESSPGVYATSEIEGVEGRSYTLYVKVGEDEFEATSTMPYKVVLDTLRFIPFSGPGGGDTYSTIPVYNDPVQENFYRFILTVNGERDDSYIVFNDNADNGTENQRPIFTTEVEVNLGDEVDVEMRCLNQESYNYFYTLQQIAFSGPGGGTTPTNPPNKFSGPDVLGYFSAHTVQKITQIAEE